MDLTFDSQQIELLGHHRLTGELIEAGFEIALPVRDRGVDLIAYADRGSSFVARPIQLKTSSGESFGVEKKFERTRNLLIAYVWGIREPSKRVTYVLTYDETLAVAGDMLNRRGGSWLTSPSWTKKGSYSTRHISPSLRHLLEPFRATPERWSSLINAKGPGAGSRESLG